MFRVVVVYYLKYTLQTNVFFFKSVLSHNMKQNKTPRSIVLDNFR